MDNKLPLLPLYLAADGFHVPYLTTQIVVNDKKPQTHLITAGHEQVVLTGDEHYAYAAWLTGRLTVEPNAAGVLDPPAAWKVAQESRYKLAAVEAPQFKTAARDVLDDAIATTVVDTPPPPRRPSINVDAVRERLKKAKGVS